MRTLEILARREQLCPVYAKRIPVSRHILRPQKRPIHREPFALRIIFLRNDRPVPVNDAHPHARKAGSSTAEKSKRHDIAAQLKPLLRNTVSWLYTCPPFCYCEEQRAYEDLEHALSEERLDRDYEEEEAHLPYLALSFCEPILRILVAIYNFCLLIRAFEMKYLRRLKRRNADAFAKAAHECFDEDDSFLILLEQMPFGGVEEFFSYPRVITGFKYFQDENNAEK